MEKLTEIIRNRWIIIENKKMWKTCDTSIYTVQTSKVRFRYKEDVSEVQTEGRTQIENKEIATE